MSVPASISHKNIAKIVTNERKSKARFDFHCECGLFSRFDSNVVKRCKQCKKLLVNYDFESKGSIFVDNSRMATKFEQGL